MAEKTQPSDEALIFWLSSGHRPTIETNTWYCRVATDGVTTAYGGWCVLSAAKRPYDSPAWGIATSPGLYFLITICVVGIMGLRTFSQNSRAHRGSSSFEGAEACAMSVRSGICMYCLCTDERACPDGCSWANIDHTVCSTRACVEAWERQKKNKAAERERKS